MKSVFKIQLWSLLILVVCTFLITGCQPQSEAFQTPSAQIIPTQTSSPSATTIISPSNEQTSEIHGILLQLENLSLSEFYEQSFFELSLRYPESLAELGIETQMGIHEAKLNDLSQKYLEQTLELEKGILAILQSYDRAGLSPEEKITFDIYEWYLQDLVAGQELNKFQYIASYFIFNSEHNQTFTFS